MELIDTEKIVEFHNDFADSYYTLSWKMTEWCNFHCEGCIAAKGGNANIRPSQQLLEQRAEKLNQFIKEELYPYLCEKQMKLRVHLIGGEVTYFDLQTILSKLGTEYIDILTFSTNLSQKVEYFYRLNFFCVENEIDMRMSASYHPEIGDKKAFIDKVKLLKRRHIKVKISYFVSDDSIDKQFAEDASNEGITMRITTERLPTTAKVLDTSTETKEFLDEYRKNLENKGAVSVTAHYYTSDGKRYDFGDSVIANSFLTNNGFCPNGYMCSAGRTYLRIEPNGDICRAGCHYLRWQIPVMGNLDDPNYKIELPKDDILCELEKDRRCTLCWNVQVYLPKEKMNDTTIQK